MNKKIYQLMSIIVALALTFGGYYKVLASSVAAPLMSANLYYVSTTGNDANPGTLALPWRTIQKAANTAVAGDTVNVLAGNYAQATSITKSGAGGIPITYQAQGTVVVQSFTVSADYIVIKGFTVISLANSAIGILVNKGGWCDIENNIVKYNAMGGISLQGLPSNPTATHDCTVKNNTLIRNGMYGLEIMGQNHLVENNDVSYTIQYSPCHVVAENWLDADGIRFFGGGHKFLNNRIHDIPFGPAGITSSVCSLANLENLNNDYVLDSHTDCFQTFDGGGDHVPGHDILFQGNSCRLLNDSGGVDSTTKGWHIQGGKNITLVNNIVHARLMAIFKASSSISAFNNSFVGYPGDLLGWGINLIGSSATIQNNIFAYQENSWGSIKPDSTSSVVAGNNCVYRTAGNPSRPADPGDVWGLDPLLVSLTDYHLQSASPCIDKGLPLVNNDFDGNLRPQRTGYDIGAYEYGGTSANTPTPTNTPTLAPTATLPIVTITSSPIPTSTLQLPTPTAIFTLIASPTLLPPTATLTSVLPTATLQVTSQPASETIYDDKNSAFVYSSGWQDVANQQAYNGSYKVASVQNASVTLSFTGQSFSILYTSASNNGIMNVYVDGVLVGTINQQTSSTQYQQRWNYPGQLTLGIHKLRLVTASRTNIYDSIDEVIVR